MGGPEREDRLHPKRAEPGFAVGAHIFQEQIAEDHVAGPEGGDALHRGGHAGLVVFVRAGPGQRHLDQRQAQGLGLPGQQGGAGAMHGDLAAGLAGGGQQRDHIGKAEAARLDQREGAVLAGGPAEDGARRGHGRQDRKLAMRRRPVAWLFSGWNWAPTILARPTMAVIGPP